MAMLVSGVWAQPVGTAVIAIRDARIHSASGPVIAKGTVLVRNGLIEAVGDKVTIPPEAWIVEGAGLNVYPGLIDPLSTWGQPTAAGAGRPTQAPAPGPTPARPAQLEQRIQTLDDGGPEERPSTTSWVRAADLLDPKSPALVSARNAGYTTAIGFPMTNVFAGQGSAYNLAGARAGRMVVGDPVGQMITLPASGFGGPFPGSLMGILSYVRQIYIDADYYKAAQALYT